MFKTETGWRFFWLAAALLWLKSYAVQRLWFHLPIESRFQEFILFISPISSILLFIWIGAIFAKKRMHIALLIMSFVTSFLLFANAVFHRFFNDFITLPLLFQTNNMGDLGNSVFSLLRPYDIFIFTDFFILLAYVLARKVPHFHLPRPSLKYIAAAAVVVFVTNLAMAETVRPQLLTRTFDREIVVKNIGTFNYHIYDLLLNSKTKTQKAFASSRELEDVKHYVNEAAGSADQMTDLFGVAKGKNVILVSMESLQNFVINRTMYGQEITPFLNDFIKESFYFNNFYHQTGQGKTSDAEFIVDNSLYPLPRGAVYFTHAQNEYNSTPKILKRHGYYATSFHANNKTFWNRDLMYQNLGYDRFFSKDDYEITEEESVGWGLKDIPFFEQSISLMKTLPQPFYSKFITLTNHHPFRLDEEDKLIPEYTSGNGTVDRYFPTVRYMDESFKRFIQELKAEGLYDNSIIVMYGDHYGISENHNRAMSEFLGEEITPLLQLQLQKVPFIVHIPGMKGKTISRAAGQIDVRPTLLHLLGIQGENSLDFGRNLFADNDDPLIVMRDGSFVTSTHAFTNLACYQLSDSEETDLEACEPYIERSTNDLDYSDKIIFGDLMRFDASIAEDNSDMREIMNTTPKSKYPLDVAERVYRNLRENLKDSNYGGSGDGSGIRESGLPEGYGPEAEPASE